MIDDPRESLCADRPFSYFLMSVLMAAQRILIIIQMDCFQLFQSDNLIKPFQNAVQIIHDVIAAVIHMAGIQTDTDMIFSFHTGNYFRQLLKRTAHFRPLSRHRFKKHGSIQAFLIHSIIYHIRNERNGNSCPLFQMGTGMEIIKTPRQEGHLCQIFPDSSPRKLSDFFFR